MCDLIVLTQKFAERTKRQEKIKYEEKLAKKIKERKLGFPGGAGVKTPPANAGDTGSSPGPGRSHMPQSN